MPVPADAKSDGLIFAGRGRPVATRTCSYQDTTSSRYRTWSHNPLRASGASTPGTPLPVPPGSGLGSVGSTAPSPNLRPSPFVPGFFVPLPAQQASNAPSVSSSTGSLSTPAGPLQTEITSTSPYGSNSALWPPPSPSLAGAFDFNLEDIKGQTISASTGSTPTKVFSFTVHAPRQLSATSRPGSPNEESPELRLRRQNAALAEVPDTGRKVMVAVAAADQDGLHTLDWACRTQVHPGDTLIIIRVVKEQKGFKGGYNAAAEMIKTIEDRAREEADRVTCHALRQLGKERKRCVDLYVKYRTGDPRSRIREMVAEERPQALVVGNNKKRLATQFFHGPQNSFLPDNAGDVQVISVQ
ncbi:hypothetical protein BC832DRAFT_472261 [Gaertneriomyces semiglobifer]|nr:hypothetical protein BC832DRAFT_472261 [Gaertneriomyces semiglobifer]